jgi:hypothetical protein
MSVTDPPGTSTTLMARGPAADLVLGPARLDYCDPDTWSRHESRALGHRTA